jgi:hypothetical protein
MWHKEDILQAGAIVALVWTLVMIGWLFVLGLG